MVIAFVRGNKNRDREEELRLRKESIRCRERRMGRCDELRFSLLGLERESGTESPAAAAREGKCVGKWRGGGRVLYFECGGLKQR
jgi:hypothetical protein